MTQKQTLRNQQRNFTRDRFIKAGLEVFNQVGFNEATVDMITNQAGANRSTFYLHFKDKIELIVATHEILRDSSEVTLGVLDKMKDPSFKEFRSWIDNMAKNWEDEHRIYEAVMQAQFTNPEIAKRNYSVICSYLTGYLSQFKGKKLTEAKLKVELFFMQLETFFYTTICLSAEKPRAKELDSLAELGYFALFGKSAK